MELNPWVLASLEPRAEVSERLRRSNCITVSQRHRRQTVLLLANAFGVQTVLLQSNSLA